MTALTVSDFHEWYHRTRRPEKVDIHVASRITGVSAHDLTSLQHSCTTYSLNQPVNDSTTDFLFCCGCGTAVHAFKTKCIQQFACTMCSRFLCSKCTSCTGCNVIGSLVSTGDVNTGRISEYCTSKIIHGCKSCDAFFYNKCESVTHQVQHLLSDNVDPVFHITKSAKIPDVGAIILDAKGVRATFAPYPRRIASKNKSIAGFTVCNDFIPPIQITAVFTDPELCPSEHRRCNIVVAHLSRFLSINPDTGLLPRPLCFINPTDIKLPVNELAVCASIVQEHCSSNTVQLVFYVPPAPDGTTDGFCLRILDIPWQQIPIVVCPGCGEWFEWTLNDDFCRHININRLYILASAVRVDPSNGQFFQFNNPCARYAHATDLSHELLHLGGRTIIPPTPDPSARCFGTYITPRYAASRTRFIGVLVTDSSIVCMHCAEHITSRTGHTSTSMLYPLAAHWHVSEPEIILFVCQTGNPVSITSIM